MKRIYDNERGVALVLSLILALVVLAAVSALLYILTMGSAMSGYQKRYETALESAKGGVNLVTQGIMSQVIGQAFLGAAALTTVEGSLQNAYNVVSPYPLTLTFTNGTTNLTSVNCLTAKLTLPELTTAGTNNWTTVGGCTAAMESTYITEPNGTWDSADLSFVLPGPGPASPTNPLNFIVYAKIVDTAIGNTSTSGLDLQGSGVVESGSGMISPPQIPYMYRIEFQAQRQSNPDEKSQVTVLYGY